MRITCQFLLLLSSISIMTAPHAVSAAGADAPRPNIVLFVSDDHGWADSGVYGDEDVQTRNIDRLARQGMRFTHAFAASPLCSPSRCVLGTGLMPFRNGAHKFGTPIKPGLKTMPIYFQALGYHTAHVGKFHHSPRKQFPYDTIIGDENAGPDFIARYDDEKPLLLVVCSHSPHTPWAPNEIYDPAKIKLPPNFVDTLETRRQRTEYYTEVTTMDDQLGKVVDALEERDWADDTLVVYTTDQGANWPFAKWCLYDAGIRVPLIARWPGRIGAGKVSAAMVSLVDLLPTCLDAAGADAPEGLDGRSFLPVLTGESREHRQVVFAAHTGNDNGGPGIANHCPMRTVRTATHKYILNLQPEQTFTTHITGCRPGSPHYLAFWDTWVESAKTDKRAARIVHDYMHRPAEELYELTADPYERNNLVGNPECAELLQSLRRRLADWRTTQGENRAD